MDYEDCISILLKNGSFGIRHVILFLKCLFLLSRSLKKCSAENARNTTQTGKLKCNGWHNRPFLYPLLRSKPLRDIFFSNIYLTASKESNSKALLYKFHRTREDLSRNQLDLYCIFTMLSEYIEYICIGIQYSMTFPQLY